MARFLCNAKVLSAIVATRRGYSAAAVQGVSSGSAVVRSGVLINKVAEESSTWVPDPVTGYYRPENHANDVDVAELREMLLKNKTSRNH